MARMSRAEMGQAIIDIVTGQKSEDAFYGQADALATSVGGIMHRSGHSLEEAIEYLDALAEGMRDHVRANWGNIEGNSH